MTVTILIILAVLTLGSAILSEWKKEKIPQIVPWIFVSLYMLVQQLPEGN